MGTRSAGLAAALAVALGLHGMSMSTAAGANGSSGDSVDDESLGKK
jgi:hypothetical protein